MPSHATAIQSVFTESSVTYDGELTAGHQYTVQNCSSLSSDQIRALRRRFPRHAVHYVHSSVGDVIVQLVPVVRRGRWVVCALLLCSAIAFFDVHKELIARFADVWPD